MSFVPVEAAKSAADIANGLVERHGLPGLPTLGHLALQRNPVIAGDVMTEIGGLEDDNPLAVFADEYGSYMQGMGLRPQAAAEHLTLVLFGGLVQEEVRHLPSSPSEQRFYADGPIRLSV